MYGKCNEKVTIQMWPIPYFTDSMRPVLINVQQLLTVTNQNCKLQLPTIVLLPHRLDGRTWVRDTLRGNIITGPSRIPHQEGCPMATSSHLIITFSHLPRRLLPPFNDPAPITLTGCSHGRPNLLLAQLVIIFPSLWWVRTQGCLTEELTRLAHRWGCSGGQGV